MHLELPDVVARGDLRAALLKAFQRVKQLEKAVKAFNELPRAHVSLEDLQAWCDPASRTRRW